MKLELKHLAPYLPYKLQMELLFFPLGRHIRTLELDCGHDFHFYLENNYVRPILRPLSDLTKEIEHNGKKFIPEYLFTEKFGSNDDTLIENMNDENNELSYSVCKDLPYYVIEWLLSMHFDIFGLLEKDLAVNINTLSVQNDG